MKLAMKFPNLEQIMLNSGFDKEITAVALEWLDIDKERDMALLEKLTVHDNKIEQNKIHDYRNAFRQDVIPLDSEELYRRIILMSYKLLDAKAYSLIEPLFWEIPDMDEKTFTKLADDAMKEVWGDEAQARSFAVRYAMSTHRKGIAYVDFPMESDPYLEAAELTSDKTYVIKLMLCANALEYMSLSKGKKLSDEAQRAVSMIKNIMQSNIEKDSINLLTALAPASFFDEQLKSHFNQYAAKKVSGICNHISIFMKRPERTLEALFSVEGTFTQEILGIAEI